MMNSPFFPIFNDHDDGFFGGGSRYYPRTSRAMAERQRRAELQRRHEALRRQKAQEDYLRRLQQAEQQEKLRRQRAAQQPSYRIVRGPGGMLYRVPVEHDDDDDEASFHSARSSEQPQQRPTYVRGPDGRIYMVRQQQPSAAAADKENAVTANVNGARRQTRQDDAAPKKDKSTAAPSTSKNSKHGVQVEVRQGDATQVKVTLPNKQDQHSAPLNDNDNKNNKTTTNQQQQNTRRRVTVIVEDVPEHELEEDDIVKSIWRNRRPGPGESWMEPISSSS